MAGTANAFTFTQVPRPRVFALPGPPGEIAAVWEAHLAAEIDRIVPFESREVLRVLRFIGRGESQIAETVEEIVKGSGLKIGYRAHLPYVEVKVWYRRRDEQAV